MGRYERQQGGREERRRQDGGRAPLGLATSVAFTVRKAVTYVFHSSATSLICGSKI